jgi:hypothetical protein
VTIFSILDHLADCVSIRLEGRKSLGRQMFCQKLLTVSPTNIASFSANVSDLTTLMRRRMGRRNVKEFILES